MRLAAPLWLAIGLALASPRRGADVRAAVHAAGAGAADSERRRRQTPPSATISAAISSPRCARR